MYNIWLLLLKYDDDVINQIYILIILNITEYYIYKFYFRDGYIIIIIIFILMLQEVNKIIIYRL